jgi:hypothetical protein
MEINQSAGYAKTKTSSCMQSSIGTNIAIFDAKPNKIN